MSTAIATPDATDRPGCPLCGSPASRLHRLSHTHSWECGDPSCGLRFACPAPSEAELRELYRTLYYPEVGPSGGSFEDTPAPVLEELVQSLGVQLATQANTRILDVGCGRGELGRIALDLGFQPTGIERDPNARAHAASAAGFPVYESLEALQQAEPQARFDVIILWQVIEHLREPWRDLAALRDLLSPGGRLVVATPNARSLRARLQGARWENVENPTHLYYFSAGALRRTLTEAGFGGIARLRVVSGFPHHGLVRRCLQDVLRLLRLDGDLIFSARPVTTREPETLGADT